MNAPTDIRSIWHAAELSGLPSAEEMTIVVKRFRRRQLTRKAVLVCVLLLMGAVMLRLAIYGSSTMPARAGHASILTGFLILIFSNMRSLRRAIDQAGRSNLEFLRYLEKAVRGRAYFYSRIQPLTFALAAAGMYLYIFDSVGTDFRSLLGTCSLGTVVLAGFWFIIRPIVQKKRMREIAASIEKLEALNARSA